MFSPKAARGMRKPRPFSKFTEFIGKAAKGITGFLDSDIGQSIMTPLEMVIPGLGPITKAIKTGAGLVGNIADSLTERMGTSTDPRSEHSINDQVVLPQARGNRAPLPPGVRNFGSLYTSEGARASKSIQGGVITDELPDEMQPQALELYSSDWTARNLGPVISRSKDSFGFINNNNLRINQSPFIHIPY